MVFRTPSGPAGWLFSALWRLRFVPDPDLSNHSTHVPCRNASPCRRKNPLSPLPKPNYISPRNTLSLIIGRGKVTFPHLNLHALPRARVGAATAGQNPAFLTIPCIPLASLARVISAPIQHQTSKIQHPARPRGSQTLCSKRFSP